MKQQLFYIGNTKMVDIDYILEKGKEYNIEIYYQFTAYAIHSSFYVEGTHPKRILEDHYGDVMIVITEEELEFYNKDYIEYINYDCKYSNRYVVIKDSKIAGGVIGFVVNRESTFIEDNFLTLAQFREYKINKILE